MSDELQQIKEQMHKFASRRGPAVLVQAKVLSINEADSTIQVKLDAGGTIDDVQLRSIVAAGDKVVVIPAVDSKVLIAAINNSDEYYVAAVEQWSKVLIVKGNLSVTITDEVIIVKNGLTVKVGNKVKIEKGSNNLKTALVKMNEATDQIVVLQGNNPDYTKLADALTMINALME